MECPECLKVARKRIGLPSPAFAKAQSGTRCPRSSPWVFFLIGPHFNGLLKNFVLFLVQDSFFDKTNHRLQGTGLRDNPFDNLGEGIRRIVFPALEPGICFFVQSYRFHANIHAYMKKKIATSSSLYWVGPEWHYATRGPPLPSAPSISSGQVMGGAFVKTASPLHRGFVERWVEVSLE